MVGGVEDAQDEIVHGHDVFPGFGGRIGGGLDEIQVDAIGPEVAPAQQHDDLGGTLPGIFHGLAQTAAMLGAHRAVVEAEVQIANFIPFFVPDVAEGGGTDLGFDGARNLGHVG